MLASAGGEKNWIYSTDFAIRLWRVSDGEQLAELSLHEAEVPCLAFSPDGRTLASSSSEAFRLWRMPDGKVLHTLKYDEKNVNGFGAIAFSPDGSVLAAGAHLWRVSDGQRLDPVPGGELFRDKRMPPPSLVAFREFAFSPNWAMVARRSNKNVCVLRVADGKSVLVTENEVWDLAFSPDNSMLALSWHDKGDNQVVISSIQDGRQSILAAGVAGGRVGFSNNGTLLAFGSGDDMRVWRIADAQLLARLTLSGKIFSPSEA
jgi:WD40 repeat protein